MYIRPQDGNVQLYWLHKEIWLIPNFKCKRNVNSYADPGRISVARKWSSCVPMLTLMLCHAKEVHLHGNHLLCETRKQLLSAKGAKPQDWEEVAWLYKMLCRVQLNCTGRKPAEMKPRRFYNPAWIRYLFSACSEFWIMVQLCIPLPIQSKQMSTTAASSQWCPRTAMVFWYEYEMKALCQERGQKVSVHMRFLSLNCAFACHCVREKAVNENTWIIRDNSAGETNFSNIFFHLHTGTRGV